MKKSYLLLMCLLVVLTGFALPRVWNGPHPACGNPYDVRQRVDLTKFTPEQIQADAMRGQVKEFTARQGFAKAKQQTAETTTYFAVQQSMYDGYSFAYMNGEVLTWNVDVTIDGTTATISNLFNLDDPNDQYNSNTENDLVGTYDATAGTITIPTPTDFGNATIAGSFYGTYPAVLSAGVVDATGTMTPESALVFNVSEDLKTISTDMHYGVSMYMADGSMSYGFQEIFAKTLLTIPTEEANLVAFADAIDFGEVYPEYPITSSIKVVNAGNTAGDFVAACEGDGFTIEPTSGTIEPLAIQDLTITYNAPRANEEYEGIVTITHDGGDILLYLMGSCIDYPDYSALIKEGEMKLTTGMEYPFAVTDTMIDVPVGVSTIPGGTGGNVISYLEATFTVPEGKLGIFSWKGLCNSAVWYAAYGSLYVDGTWIQDWAGVTEADISGDYQFAPGEHKIRFQYNLRSRRSHTIRRGRPVCRAPCRGCCTRLWSRCMCLVLCCSPMAFCRVCLRRSRATWRGSWCSMLPLCRCCRSLLCEGWGCLKILDSIRNDRACCRCWWVQSAMCCVPLHSRTLRWRRLFANLFWRQPAVRCWRSS